MAVVFFGGGGGVFWWWRWCFFGGGGGVFLVVVVVVVKCISIKTPCIMRYMLWDFILALLLQTVQGRRPN